VAFLKKAAAYFAKMPKWSTPWLRATKITTRGHEVPPARANAAMESWNHRFKVEAVHGERFLTRSEARYQVFE
jgi:hypothetical protein